MKKIILLIVVLQVVATSMSKAQVDPHFSQIYAYPLWLNPALAGVFDGNARVTANFKQQWTQNNNGYQTVAISTDFKATDKVGIGINIIDQLAGNYNYSAAYGTFGYGIPVSADGTKKLHFGLQVGFIDHSFASGGLEFDNQYNPLVGFDPNIPSGETYLSTNSFIFDSGAGIYYYDANDDNTSRIFGGASVFHINGARDPFATAGARTVLPVRFNIYGGVKIKASADINLTPSIIYIRQQDNQIRAVDLQAELHADAQSSIMIGALYRYDDAVVAEVGYRVNNTSMGLSYDVNTSGLSSATNGRGGLEVSLNYIFTNRVEHPSNAAPQF